jgi:50S ribosomal protein L16 3-hydroxylase
MERRWLDARFFTGNKRIMGDIYDYLPKLEDKDLLGYSKRMDKLFGEEDYFLYITNFHCHIPQVWQRVCSFLSEIYQLTGLPANFADLELFLGRYSVTPGGIHRDKGTSFQFVIEGKKTMYVWPRQQFWKTGTEEAIKQPMLKKREIELYKDHGEPLTGNAGDIIYWSSNHWHVGLSEDFSASLTLALYMDGTVNRFVETAISNLYTSELFPSFPQDQNLVDLSEKMNTIKNQVNTGCETAKFNDALMKEWLRHLSAFGFKYFPAPKQEIDISQKNLFKIISAIPIVYAQNIENKLICGCNGHLFTIDKSDAAMALIDYINSQQYINVTEMMNASPLIKILSKEFITSFLSKLYIYGHINEE